MTSSKTSENNNSVSLFPFLAVLLCTMGALLVLLVILVQRAAERALLPEGPSELVADGAGSTSTEADGSKSLQLRQQLDEIGRYQKQIDELRAEGNRRLEDERLRLSHAEEHTRRLEEQLAKLAIATEQLKQTEENQTVDQQQAEAELARLEQLVIDTQKQLELMQEEKVAGKKSYAIVPYKGPNGTFRKPIYIECTAKGVIIQPEGLKLSEMDFVAPSWPGNPLAAVLRASREYLNNKAAQEGAAEPPDPYPLILVRPDGIEAYALARAAITSWDSEYGYEFVDQDMKLAYPGAADPQLLRAQHHALMIARERLVHLVQAAPSRFRGLQMGEGPSSAGGGSGLSGTGSDGSYAAGNGFGGGSELSSDGNHDNGNVDGSNPSAQESGVPQYGNLTGGPDSNGDGSGYANGSEVGSEAGGTAIEGGEPNLVGRRYAQQGDGSAGGQGAPTNAPSEPLNGSDSGAAAEQMAGSASSGGGGSAPGSPGMSFGTSQDTTSIADSKGSNWAIEKAHRKSMAIRRPIPVVVRDNKMILLANKNFRRGVDATVREISLDQPLHDISEEFKAALKERIEDWGLAGSGMYWRPVLELDVEPGAQMTAQRITTLLQDSGVEVQLPQTADANGQGGMLR